MRHPSFSHRLPRCCPISKGEFNSKQDTPGTGGRGELRYEFPNGVWVFELAAVTDPGAVAAVLGITQQPGETVSESVAAALRRPTPAASDR